MKNVHLFCIGLIAVAAAPTETQAQRVAPPPPSDSGTRYRYDLERYLFATPATELAQRAQLSRRYRELEALTLRASQSAALLYHTLALADSVTIDARRHDFYLGMRTSTNTLDDASAAARSANDAALEAATNRVRSALQRIDTARLNRWIDEFRPLATYRFAVASEQRFAAHTLKPVEQNVLTAMVPLAAGWPQSLYRQLIARTDFGKVQTSNGPLDVYRQAGAIANDPDSAVRSAGSRQLWAGYNSQRDLYATALVGTVRAANVLAHQRHYADAPDESYFRAWLAQADVRALITRVRAQATLWKRYQRVVAAHANWAVAQQRVSTARRGTMSLDSASRLISMAVAPLGRGYQGEMAALLDPANARLDVAGGQHRAAGGHSIGGGAAVSGLYLFGFEGFYPDLSTLAHESGHAVENQLLLEGKVPAVYASHTPSYLSESYALFNELIVADTLFRGSTTDAARQFYLAQFLNKAMEVFHGAQDADLEQSVYEAVGGGRVTTADQLDSLTRAVDESYTIAGETRPEVKARWITARLMYNDPLYLFNYMYSGMLSLKYFEQYSLHRERFAPRYVEMLGAGYRAPPVDALKRNLGIDLSDPKLLDDGIALLSSRLGELEVLYAKQEAGGRGRP